MGVGLVGGQGGCERRIAVIVEMQNKIGRSGRGWGVEGCGLVDREGVGWLVAMLGIGGDVGYGDVNQE